MNYMYEAHFHTADVSTCAHISAQEAVELYKNAGYSGVVVTDHFTLECFEKKYPGETWKDKVDYFLRGYRNAKKCETETFSVMLGIELRFPENDNDYLVYGVDEQFLYDHEDIVSMTAKQFKKVAEVNQLTVIQAHPFRIDSNITNPRYIDGVEIYNGNKRHDSSNNMAEIWAKKHGFITTSGSDFHEYEDLARGGVSFNRFVKDVKEFRAELLSGKYELKRP
ncbi:MAG: PHP domain-containing protein [Clostridia bacterium]|nr:PHP domain-containing protein [Clostridia bacterium]